MLYFCNFIAAHQVVNDIEYGIRTCVNPSCKSSFITKHSGISSVYLYIRYYISIIMRMIDRILCYIWIGVIIYDKFEMLS